MSGGMEFQMHGTEELKVPDLTGYKLAEGTVRLVEKEELRIQEGDVRCLFFPLSLQLALSQSSDMFSTSSKIYASAQIITALLWLK